MPHINSKIIFQCFEEKLKSEAFTKQTTQFKDIYRSYQIKKRKYDGKQIQRKKTLVGSNVFKTYIGK